MIDRFGNHVRVGWAAHELLWLEAALSLHALERRMAYKDISEMTGRSVDSIRQMGEKLKEARRATNIEMLPVSKGPAKLPPSALRAPTLAQLMGGR